MKSIAQLIQELKRQGIRLSLGAEGKLRIENKRGALAPELLREIKTRKEELLRFIRQHREGQRVIERLAEAEDYALSSAQWRMWLASVVDESANANVICRAIEMRGELQTTALQAALEATVKRHESLRTVFRENDRGEVRQKILGPDPSAYQIRRIDFSAIAAESEVERRVREWLTGELRAPFYLRRGPLLRTALIKTGADTQIFVISMHHIISDGWSVEVLLGELLARYRTALGETATSWSPLPIQYKDYAAWQLAELATEAMGVQRQFWLDQFAETVPPLDLATDFARPPVPSYHGAQVKRSLPTDLVQELRRQCQERGQTLFAGLLALQNVLLYRYTGQCDLVIGTPVAGRERSELEGQIGFYVNTLALRNRVEKGESFGELLERLGTQSRRAFEHQSFPFDRLVEELQWPREASRHPLFDILMILQGPSQLNQLEWPGAELSEYPVDKRSAQFDLTFEYREGGEGLELTIDYSTDLYAAWRVEQMGRHLEHLLRQVVEVPGTSVDDLALLSEAEREQLLVQFNDTQVNYPKEVDLVALFEAQVAQRGAQLAVRCGTASLSFAEVEEYANRFAHFLRDRHRMRAGDLIALQLERSEWMLVAILGILKGGGAYVPIDPSNPPERVRYLLEHSGSAVHINAAELTAFREQLQQYAATPPPRTVTADQLLAVIYTSGSTNRPKGVSIYTSNLLNRLYWMWQRYPFAEGEVGSVKTSIGFVDHLWELFGPLLRGIPLVIFSRDLLLDTEAFIEALARERISRIVLVPTLLKSLLLHREACREKLGGLRYWTCSGEVLSPELVEAFYDTFEEHHLFNIYGSTEVTADATVYDFSADRLRNSTALAAPKLFRYDAEESLYETLDHTQQRRIFPKEKGTLTAVPESLQSAALDRSLSFAEYRDFIQHELAPNVVNVSSARFIGHMTGPVPPIINDLHNCVNLLNQNLVKFETSGMGTQLERQVLGNFHHLLYAEAPDFYERYLQNPSYSLGNITSGGTVSNITAMSYALARQLSGSEAGKGLNKVGLVNSLRAHGYSRVVLIGSAFCHYSMSKALKLLGLGTESFVPFDLDVKQLAASKAALQVRIDQLRAEGALVLAIIGVAGTTEAGKIDPLEPLAEVAEANDIHFHVDGAFGGAFILSDKIAPKLRGIERADTVTICGHKQLYLPLGISVCIFKAPDFVKLSEINTRYQARKGSIDLGKYTIEGSRPFSALVLHGALHLVGKEGYGEILEKNYDRAQLFSQLIRAHEAFDLYEVPHLNILLYRYVSEKFREKLRANQLNPKELLQLNEVNRQIQREQFRRGRSFVSYTELLANKSDAHGVVWFRSVLMNPYTKQEDLEAILVEQVQIAHELEGRQLEVAEVWSRSRKIPIGKPISNVRVYILDAAFQLVPIGVAGEICIAGEGVAKGYLNNESLTEEKFVANPFIPGERMYRTGDIGRWLPDGNIEFVSRKDDQVKVRGYRIELGEINTVLRQSALVKQGVALARQDAQGDATLVAYLVPELGYEAEDLRRELRRRLPSFMVPTLLVELEALPLTASGKINKKALPDPHRSAPAQRALVPATTATERQIAQLWKELLGIDEVGIHDNFFERGGHSLTLTRLVNKMRSELGVAVKVTDVFRFPTIYEISRLPAAAVQSLIPRASERQHFPLTPAQRGVWVLSHFQGGSAAYHLPAIFEVEGALDREALDLSFRLLLERHESLRTVFQDEEEEPWDTRQFVQTVPEAVLDYRELVDGAEGAERLIDEWLRQDFDLEEGPLYRATVLRMGERRHLIVLVLHHLISDGYSFRVLTRDWLALYHGLKREQPAALPPLALQYGDYALWLERQLAESALDGDRDYWLDQLAGPLPRLDLSPLARPKNQTFVGAHFRRSMDRHQVARLESYAAQRNGTLFMGLLALVNTLLHRYTAAEDLLIGSPVAARNHSDLEDQIGFYVNTLVFRTRFKGSDTYATLFERVKQVTVAALEHQAYPFDQLVDDLRPPKDTSRNALFDVAMVLQTETNSVRASGGGLQVRPYAGTYRVSSKFDLTFDFLLLADGLQLTLEYNTDLFSSEFITKLYGHLEVLLATVARGQDWTLNEDHHPEASLVGG
ncbi:MAG: condensation domain-containing protein [Bacteroidota bacterium]